MVHLVYKLSAIITQEKDWFVARSIEIGVTSQGKTFEEARKNLQEAIELYIESFGTEDMPVEKSEPIFTSLEITA